MNPERIKICGITTREAVMACNAAGCGFAGFIAHPASPRYLSAQAMQPLCQILIAPTRSVAVTVDASDAVLDSYVESVAPDLLQLHGSESPARCLELKMRYGLPIIKAAGITSTTDIAALESYYEVADMLLLDSKRQDGSSGGVGAPFNWEIAHGFAPPLPWFLSGGISIENVADAMREVNPPFLDVSSALESEKGIKDVGKIRGFMNHIHTL